MEIRLLKKHGKSLREIAEEVGCSVNTVRRHLELTEKPKYGRQIKRLRKVEEYESYLFDRQESAKPLWIPATCCIERLWLEVTKEG